VVGATGRRHHKNVDLSAVQRGEVGSGRRIRTSTDEKSLDPSPALSDQDAIDSGRIPAAPETRDDASDPLRTIEGRRVERQPAATRVIERVAAVLREAVRCCGAEHEVRALRRTLLDALRQLDEDGAD
jgi:hypothetical protein